MSRAFRPKDFLDLAALIGNAIATCKQLVVGKTFEEAWIRTGISRAYYGAFLYIRNLAGLTYYRRSDVHEKLINNLKMAGSNYKYIGHRLAKLRQMRNKADYDLPPSYSPTLNDLIYAIRLSKHIMKRASKLRWPPSSLGIF
ncbi:MAG: hypothetical protein DRN06_08085 [Thermoprotei archaeon]|nr:MAG: hypothetical protein DRN06_08085 [Thermoprotei archaeon]